MKIEAAAVALTVMAVETFALVVAVGTADGVSDGGQNRVATKVLCNKEGGGDGSKSNDDKGGGQVTATAMTWAMVTATRLAGDEEGKCKGSKGNCNGDKGGWQWQQRLKPFQRWQRQKQWLWRWQTTTETVGAGNNQQNVVGGSGSGRDSSRASGDHCSAAVMAGRGGGAAEVTTMRAAETATNTPFYPWPW